MKKFSFLLLLFFSVFVFSQNCGINTFGFVRWTSNKTYTASIIVKNDYKITVRVKYDDIMVQYEADYDVQHLDDVILKIEGTGTPVFLKGKSSYNPDTFIFRISQEGNIISGTTYDSSQVRNKLEILDSDNLDNNLALLEQFYTEKDADYPEIVKSLLYFDYTNKKKKK